MSRHRFFLQRELLGVENDIVTLPLTSADVRHATRSLRVRPGEQIDVVTPSGIVWRVEVVAGDDDSVVEARLLEAGIPAPGSGRAHVTLVFGVSKGSKNDEIIEGAVEVGVERILPALTERSIVRYSAEKRAERAERWSRVAAAAAKQSKRTTVPAVASPVELAALLGELAGYDRVLVAWEDAGADSPGLRAALGGLRDTGTGRVALIVGPEGGLSEREVRSLAGLGARVVSLGETILRAETAAVVASALVMYELGGLGNDG